MSERSSLLHAVHRLDVLAPDFDATGPDVAAAQFAYWRADTDLGPAVLRYEDVVALLRDRRFSQGSAAGLDVQGIGDGPVRDWWQDMILNIGGERHERLRRLVMPAFRPGVIEALRPRMREQIAVAIDGVRSGADDPISTDVVATIADPYPIAVLADVLGIPDDERAAVRRWTTDLGLVFGFHGAAYLARIEAALLGLYGVADRLIAERRRRAGDDLVSRLVDAEDGGDRLNEEELRSLVVTMLFAGHDTTKHQLALGLHAFTEHPSAWELLAANPGLAVTATEEVMRVVPTVSVVTRIAIEDITYRDLELPAGTFVQLFTGIANRDRLMFGDTSFDITATRPRQLAFGGGLHHCVGHLLARAELEEALPALAEAFADLRVGGPVEWRPPIGIVGPCALPLTFRRRVPTGS